MQIGLLILVLAASCSLASGNSADYSATTQIGQLMTVYKGENGRLPTKWEEISPMLKAPINSLYPQVQPTKRYAFIDQPVSLTLPIHTRILVVERSPFYEGTGDKWWWQRRPDGLLGRIVICEFSSGEIWPLFVKEEDVREAFAKAKVSLPEAGPPEPRPQNDSGLTWFVTVTIVLLATVAGLWRQYSWPRRAA